MGSVHERRSTLRLEHLPAMRRTLTAPLVQGEDGERDATEGIAEVLSPLSLLAGLGSTVVTSRSMFSNTAV